MTHYRIELENVRYRYDASQSTYNLNGVSFHVKQGEWLSIVGHNGSGKSTTVRLIDGLLAAESGAIYIDGDQLTVENVWDKRRLIGMVFQNPDNQFVGATVEDDVAFGLENQGVALEDMQKRVQEALDQVGMTAFAKREPARLSGGQKQRVAIAGVVALRPSILILDEATSMLDPEGRLQLMRVVKKIKQDYQMTVLSITHDLDEIALSDRVLVLKDGEIESSSRPGELFVRKDLASLGLEAPFSQELAHSLRQAGMDLPDRYFTEEELEEHVWQLVCDRSATPTK